QIASLRDCLSVQHEFPDPLDAGKRAHHPELLDRRPDILLQVLALAGDLRIKTISQNLPCVGEPLGLKFLEMDLKSNNDFRCTLVCCVGKSICRSHRRKLLDPRFEVTPVLGKTVVDP